MYAQKYVHECLLEFDWSVASDIIAAEPSFQVHCHVIYIYIYTNKCGMVSVRLENLSSDCGNGKIWEENCSGGKCRTVKCRNNGDHCSFIVYFIVTVTQK